MFAPIRCADKCQRCKQEVCSNNKKLRRRFAESFILRVVRMPLPDERMCCSESREIIQCEVADSRVVGVIKY